jgi:MFS family permease
MVELPYLGSRGTLSISTSTFITNVYQILCLMFSSVLTGVFILASTTSHSSNALLGWNCAYSFVSNIMYGVLYALSPEVFPTKDRGTGNALVASANRIFGIMVMAYHASQNET